VRHALHATFCAGLAGECGALLNEVHAHMRALTQRSRPSRPPAGPSRAPPPSRSHTPSSGPNPSRTQTTSRAARANRNSISSDGPPHPHLRLVVIPTYRSSSTHPPHLALDMGSPLSVHGSADWYLPAHTPSHVAAHPDFSLSTPNSISSHAHFID
jgi:hypothetical protein